MNTTELAYLAGILDGEGYFAITYIPKSQTYRACVGVMNTSLDLISWLHAHCGGYVYNRSNQPCQKAHWKDRYEWKLKVQNIVPVSQSVLPYLIIKGRHAQTIIDFRNTYGPTRTAVSEPVLALRKQHYLTLKQLNHRSRGC